MIQATRKPRSLSLTVRKTASKSFEDIVRHLTDTHVCNTYYSARHFAQKAKLSMATLTDDGNSDDDIQQTMLKTIRECSLVESTVDFGGVVQNPIQGMATPTLKNLVLFIQE